MVLQTSVPFSEKLACADHDISSQIGGFDRRTARPIYDKSPLAEIVHAGSNRRMVFGAFNRAE
jgi:hypothetical protein